MKVTSRLSGMVVWMAVLILSSGCGRKSGTGAQGQGAEEASKAVQFEVSVMNDCSSDLLDVALATNGFGVICGVAVIYVTHDFGAHWQAAYGPAEKGPELVNAILAGPETAWCLSRSKLLRTTDGGKVWAECTRPKGTFYYYGFGCFRAGTLLLMEPPTCGATVYTTTDGQAWGRLSATLPRNDYETVWFDDDGKHGWVAGNYGRFASTADGGKTWAKRDLPEDPHIVQVQFLDLANGWARLYGTAQRLMRTADGGASWRPATFLPPPARAARDMQWFSPDRGLVLAEVKTGKTQVLRTDDGGKTWALVGEHDADFTAMSFVSPERGWLVGRKGMVCRYGTP